MVTNRHTGFDLQDDDAALDTFAEIDAPARPEPPKPTKINCIPLPNYASDRRHDVRARDYANAVTLPYKDGWFARFAQTADPGWYFGELRASNQIVGGDVFEVKPGGRLGETTSAPPALTMAPASVASAAPALPESSTAQSIKALTEAVREAKGFAQEMAPPPVPAAPTENVEAIVERALAKQREEFTRALAEMKAAQPQPAPAAPVERPKTLAEQLRELKESRELLGEIVGGSQRGEQPDPFKQFMTTYEMVMELTDRVSSGRTGEDAGTFDKVLRFADRHADKIAHVPALLSMLKPGRMQEMAQAVGADVTTPAQGAQTGTQAQPAAQAQPQRPQPPQNEQEALMLVAHVGAQDMALNKRTGRVADLIEEQVRRFPKLEEFMREFVALPPGEALALFMQLTGRTDLAALNHSISFIENLQDDLRVDEDDAPGSDDLPADAPNIVEMASHARAS